jgi:ABC-type uncharacterized transport system substrate-binding protein
MGRKTILIFAAILLIQTVALHALPHMWVDYQVEAEIGGSKLDSIRVIWIFDEFFSSSLIMDMDTNKDRTFQSDEERTYGTTRLATLSTTTVLRQSRSTERNC